VIVKYLPNIPVAKFLNKFELIFDLRVITVDWYFLLQVAARQEAWKMFRDLSVKFTYFSVSTSGLLLLHRNFFFDDAYNFYATIGNPCSFWAACFVCLDHLVDAQLNYSPDIVLFLTIIWVLAERTLFILHQLYSDSTKRQVHGCRSVVEPYRACDLRIPQITVCLDFWLNSENELSLMLDQQPGINCHRTFAHRPLWTFLNGSWRHIYLQKLLTNPINISPLF